MITSPTTPQEIYDTVIQHLITQGEPAKDENGICLYRHTKNDRVLKCAVGVLFSDEEYRPDWERQAFGTLCMLGHYNGPLEAHQTLLDSLQKLHDSPNSWSSNGGLSKRGKESAENIAIHFRLMPYNFQ